MTAQPFDVSSAGLTIDESPIITSNGANQLIINSGATGDVGLLLTSLTKAVTLTVDTNQELKVQGGVNSFVFDVSSATGGITFPDGTTQNTAAAGGGGGGGPSLGTLQSIQNRWAGQVQPWLCVNESNIGYNTNLITTSNDISWGNTVSSGRVAYYPIYFQRDMTIDYVAVLPAGTGTGDFAIFASDSDNFPTGSPVLSFSAGTAPSTTIFSWDEVSVAATAFTKGLYFLAIDASAPTYRLLGNLAAGNVGLSDTASTTRIYGPAVTPFCNYFDNQDSLTTLFQDYFSFFLEEASATSIPGTINLANLVMGGSDRDGTNDKPVIPALMVREST